MTKKNKTDKIRLSTRKYGSRYVTTHLMTTISTRNKLKLALMAAEQNSSLSEIINWLVDEAPDPPKWDQVEKSFNNALARSDDQARTMIEHIRHYREVYKNEGITPKYNSAGINTS